MSESVVTVRHSRFQKAWTSIFTRRIVADCMTHGCSTVATRTPRLDVCCQYGCDVDVAERDEILARGPDIRALLRTEVKDAPWFEAEEYDVPEYPSGRIVRTSVFEDGCVFLAHDGRGCAIHRAAIERGFDLNGVKPGVCRLYPLYFDGDTLVIDDDYPAYSCAYVEGPTLYRLTRDTLAELFGADLVVALDEAERRVHGALAGRAANAASS